MNTYVISRTEEEVRHDEEEVLSVIMREVLTTTAIKTTYGVVVRWTALLDDHQFECSFAVDDRPFCGSIAGFYNYTDVLKREVKRRGQVAAQTITREAIRKLGFREAARLIRQAYMDRHGI